MGLAITLHLLAAVIWVGGIFFAFMVLRPVAAERLEPPLRLAFLSDCFGRFFPWVWGAVLLLPATGYWVIFSLPGGMKDAGLHVHVMNGLGTLMIALYLFLYVVPYRRLKRAVAGEEWSVGAIHMATMRRIIGTNLILGLLTTAVAAGGRYL